VDERLIGVQLGMNVGMNVLWLLSLLWVWSLAQHLPPCEKGKDSYGEWIPVSELSRSELLMKDYERHFYGGKSGEAKEFGSVWVPAGCSMHRFTNATVHLAVQHLISKHNYNENRVHLLFMGDSASRGIFCGLVRLLSGSEVYGPCYNTVCGDWIRNAVSTSSIGKYFDTDFGDNFRITFVYIESFYVHHFDWALEFAVTVVQPSHLILNMGAWDFDAIARAHMNETASPYCDSNETRAISDRRADAFTNETMWLFGNKAKEFGNRVIYRNNHYNKRFGVFCADEKFEALLKGSPWEVLDSRRISEKVWLYQNWDGFHFDRFKQDTPEHHKLGHDYDEKVNKTYFLGMMEMQFVQTMLNSVFYEALDEIRSKHEKRKGK